MSVFVQQGLKISLVIGLQYVAFRQNNNIHFWFQFFSWTYFSCLCCLFLGRWVFMGNSSSGKLAHELIASKLSALVVCYGVVYGNITSAGLGTNGTYFIYLLIFSLFGWELEKFLSS